MFQILHFITILYPCGNTVSGVTKAMRPDLSSVSVWFALTTIIHPVSSISTAFPGLCISAKSYYYPSLYISLQFMKMIIVLVTRGSKGSEWKIGCGKLSLPTLAPRQPLLVLTIHFTSFTNFYVLYTSYYPSLATKSQTRSLLVTGAQNSWI